MDPGAGREAAPLRFDALLEPLAWGTQVYTVIKVPEEVAALARAAGTRRLRGTIEGEPVNVGLNRADVVAAPFVYVGPALRRRLRARAGDLVECVLGPADPDEVPIPPDVLLALEAAGRREAFARRPAPERRRLLVPIESASRTATRERRTAAMIESLPTEPDAEG